MEKLERDVVQAYVNDYWLIMSEEERKLAVSEGFTPPHTCEVIVVDFITGMGEIGRYVA